MNTRNHTARLLAILAAIFFTHAADSQGVLGMMSANAAQDSGHPMALLVRDDALIGARPVRACDAVDAFGNPVRPCRSR